MSSTPAVPNGAIAQLTDIIGSRTVTVKATIDGMPDVEETLVVTFGAGPLSRLRIPSGGLSSVQWANNALLADATSLPAAAWCGEDPVDYASWGGAYMEDHSGDTGLPSVEELQNVNSSSGRGAALAAGWIAGYYWSGRMLGRTSSDSAEPVSIGASGPTDTQVTQNYMVVCRRRFPT
jgi:hypothetical protein